ncbi:hypothetical protein BRADI_1g55513v3 [Brachypodium distachyon]|uniref:Uncharacterized protein n=1 Tax=Brachypodium distachyon TaxID=15368 RepID=A0A0Q3HCM0_BRADI|nr:hypothetical protein BRADI_1g55513v3 [Brachypodium distachyon]
MRLPIAYIIQFTIIGKQGVGKTCLQLQFTDNTFPTVYEATNDIEYGTRTITVGNQRIKLQILDTCLPVV